KKDASKRELVARISGERAKAVDLAEQFPAQWKQVTIGQGRATSSLGSGDCELLEQVRRRILPKLAVRVIKDNTPCPPNPGTLTRPSIVVEALIEVPKPDDVGKQRDTKKTDWNPRTMTVRSRVPWFRKKGSRRDAEKSRKI